MAFVRPAKGLIVDNDADNDGVCDADEVTGCTDPAACNYDSDPTTDTDNTLCTYTDGICETCEDGLIVDNDRTTMASVMPTRSLVVPTRAACNYDSTPTDRYRQPSAPSSMASARPA